MSKEVTLKIQLDDGVELPKFAHEGDACFDLRSNEEIIISPNMIHAVKTGIKVVVPNGYELKLYPRSGISLKTYLRLGNSVGIIDNGYTDEIGVILHNTYVSSDNDHAPALYDIKGKFIKLLDNNKYENGTHYLISKGDRIVQAQLKELVVTNLVKIDSVKDETDNDRNGGFGSSGVK